MSTASDSDSGRYGYMGGRRCRAVLLFPFESGVRVCMLEDGRGATG
jgi:hypothetical protein